MYFKLPFLFLMMPWKIEKITDFSLHLDWWLKISEPSASTSIHHKVEDKGLEELQKRCNGN